jgi:hypothetical protein
MQRILSFFFGVLGVVYGAMFLMTPVSAFSLQPALIDVEVQPGGTQEVTIDVVNDENIERIYYISIQKFFPKGETGQQEFLPLSDTSGLPSWIFVSQPFITLKPGEARTIPFAIRTPLDARAGGYYAAIFFSTEPPLQKSGGKILTGARTGALVFLTIQGQLSPKLELKGFSVSPMGASSLPVLFDVSLENTGNIHTVPKGTIVIKNLFGSVVARLPMNEFGSRVLPNSARVFSIVWQKQPPILGTGVWHTIKEEWRNFGLGKYTASLEVSGAESLPDQTFSIWPWHLLAFIISGFILILILLRLYKKWIVHRATVR